MTNPKVRDEIVKIMGFWLQMGVSGFRLDAVPFLLDPAGARPETGDLELQGLHPGTQSGDLVEQTPVGRRTYVAVEGLRHLDSL